MQFFLLGLSFKFRYSASDIILPVWKALDQDTSDIFFLLCSRSEENPSDVVLYVGYGKNGKVEFLEITEVVRKLGTGKVSFGLNKFS